MSQAHDDDDSEVIELGKLANLRECVKVPSHIQDFLRNLSDEDRASVVVGISRRGVEWASVHKK